MRITVIHPAAELARQLQEALSEELPDARISIWEESRADDADYAVGCPPPPGYFSRAAKLKAFFSTWAGVERILAMPDLPASLPVGRIEDAGMGAQLVSYCLAEVLCWLRRRDEYAGQQRAGIWRELPAAAPADWPIGVFGLGVLGTQVASAFGSLGFPVHGYARTRHGSGNIQCFSASGGESEFAEFMSATRVLILMAPLTPQTRDRFDRTALACLPPSAYVINVARGELLVDEALLESLDSGHLAGAALDVFREEPLPPQHPFWVHPRIRMTPHVGAAALLGPTVRQVATNIRRFSRNEPVSGLVDRDRGY